MDSSIDLFLKNEDNKTFLEKPIDKKIQDSVISKIKLLYNS
jgi:hypothetical protein